MSNETVNRFCASGLQAIGHAAQCCEGDSSDRHGITPVPTMRAAADGSSMGVNGVAKMVDPQSPPPPFMGAPHVVLLGAGASAAACPTGDKCGRRLPCMPSLVQVVGLGNLMRTDATDPTTGDDFETAYSRLVSSGADTGPVEKAVFNYFSQVELPDEPTLYDDLVLSLRGKDVIATFNWDPLLWQALCRNHRRAEMPRVLFLHGNVAVAFCDCDRPISVGWPRNACQRCGELLVPSPLLFPVRQKNYTAHPVLDAAWQELRRALRAAYLLTVFGYGAPETDVDAVAMLKEGWGPGDSRAIEQVEIIDIKDRKELVRTWSPFFCRDHFHTCHNFYESVIARHPRRSCESMFSALMNNQPYRERPMPSDRRWCVIDDWLSPLVADEKPRA